MSSYLAPRGCICSLSLSPPLVRFSSSSFFIFHSHFVCSPFLLSPGTTVFLFHLTADDKMKPLLTFTLCLKAAEVSKSLQFHTRGINHQLDPIADPPVAHGDECGPTGAELLLDRCPRCPRKGRDLALCCLLGHLLSLPVPPPASRKAGLRGNVSLAQRPQTPLW